MRTLLLLLTCLLTLNLLTKAEQSNNQTIRGSVVDAVTGFPLIGATIILVNSDPITGTTTDENGNFELNGIELGRQSIKVTYLGYKPQTIPNLLLTSGKQMSVEIKLEEDVTQMDEVVVKAKSSKEKPLNEMATVSARTFSVEETERFAGSLGDPARMVANYAGVSMQNDSRNDIIIRGNSPSGVLWRLEGIEIANPNHFGASGTTGGPVSMINNNLLANSDFMTGAFPAEFGNALSGAFDLNFRSGNTNKYEYVGQVGFNGFELGAEGPMFSTQNGQKASFIGSFRYSTLEVMKNLGFNIGTGTAVPEYKDFTFLADIPGTKAGRFKLFGLWGDSFIRLGRDYTDTTDNSYSGKGTAIDFGSGLAVIGASHTYFFTDKVRLTSTLSYQNTTNTTVFDSVKNQGALIMPYFRGSSIEDKFSFNTKLTCKLNAKNNFSAGFTIDQYQVSSIDSVHNNDYAKFIRTLDLDGNLNLYQAFAEWKHNFTNELAVYGGLHTQVYTQNNSHAIEPRFGLNYELTPQHSFQLGFGMHSQMQPKAVYFVQTYDSITQTYWTTNENLDFTRSIHYVAGYNYLITQNLRFKAETYYQSLHDVPVKQSFPEFSMLNSGADFGGPLEDSLVNKGTGTNYGVELTFEKFLSNGYYFLFTSSLFNSNYKGYDGVERNTAFNGNYVCNLLAGYEYKINEQFMLTFDIKGTLAGGKRYVPVDTEESQLKKAAEYDWSHAFEKKYADYFRTDLRIGFKHNAKRFNQELGVDLQNITNYKSVYMQGYDVDKNETYNIYQQGFLPMVLYRIQF